MHRFDQELDMAQLDPFLLLVHSGADVDGERHARKWTRCADRPEELGQRFDSKYVFLFLYSALQKGIGGLINRFKKINKKGVETAPGAPKGPVQDHPPPAN